MKLMHHHLPLLFSVFFFVACSGGSDNGQTENKDSLSTTMSFKTLTPEESGITFTNSIKETDSFNFFNYEYIYNGGGVAVGDINNDGLSDIYFTGNQVSDKLYLNKGNLKFEDITNSAIGKRAAEGWRTGVVMVDINNDGWLDIYVSRSGNPADRRLMQNQLYINNKNLTFTEAAAEYGVNSQRPTTQSAFFDYDNDGDLDLYIMNHPYNTSNTREDKKSVFEVERIAKMGSDFSDQLFRNDNGKYVDVSKEAGIANHAFGLGLAIGDINNDGFQDIYVSNDYMAPDYLYMNNGNGTFAEEIKERTNHISSFSMGNDMADFNNDGFMDIITVDMVSEDHIRSKKNMGGMSTKNFWDVVNIGYHFQYMFNALQLNNGDGSFSEIGQLAGISKTDWSWAPLFADFDNDGFQDLFITNGYRRDTRDNDFNLEAQKREGKFSGFQEALELMPATKIQNYVFQNSGNLKFEKRIEDWHIDQPVNSNGAAYADFDNDGDLDLVVNNIDEVSFVMENELSTSNGYLKIKLKGSEKNIFAVGARIEIQTDFGLCTRALQPSRGYLSSVDPVIHFGLGNIQMIQSVKVVFSDGKQVVLNDVAKNQIVEIDYANATAGAKTNETDATFFTQMNEPVLSYQHQEITVNDFEREILLPHKMSQLGPFVSVGDLNGDSLEDLYIGGPRGISGKMFIQQPDGIFKEISGPWVDQKAREELGSVIFDIEGDGDNDLLVLSGSNEYKFDSPLLMPQLYVNYGNLKFVNESDTRLPMTQTSAQRAAVGDIDKDGDLDLFIGGRQTPGFYPFAPRSYLLKNDQGKFVDVTEGSPDLLGPGMITDVVFDDFDNDQDLDLICVGEWMPISFFENNVGSFTNVSEKYGLSDVTGWWSSISIGDFNSDGKNDYVVGNLGENNKFHPDTDHPLEIYCADFDGSGTYDIVLGKYQNGVCYPVRGRQCSSEQMPFIQNKFPTYTDFAVADLEKIYGKENLDKALHYSATDFKSSILLSDGINFSLRDLPVEAQFGPLNKCLIKDFDGDGNLDILGVGNNFCAEVETIRYDGGRGVMMLGDGKGGFRCLSPTESGFLVRTDVRDMVAFGNRIAVFGNLSKTVVYETKKSPPVK